MYGDLLSIIPNKHYYIDQIRIGHRIEPQHHEGVKWGLVFKEFGVKSKAHDTKYCWYKKDGAGKRIMVTPLYRCYKSVQQITGMAEVDTSLMKELKRLVYDAGYGESCLPPLITKLEVACDYITAHECEAVGWLDFIKQNLTVKGTDHLGIVYSDSRGAKKINPNVALWSPYTLYYGKRTGSNFWQLVVYCRNSKATGEPCVHTEWRMFGSRTVKRFCGGNDLKMAASMDWEAAYTNWWQKRGKWVVPKLDHIYRRYLLNLPRTAGRYKPELTEAELRRAQLGWRQLKWPSQNYAAQTLKKLIRQVPELRWYRYFNGHPDGWALS